MEKQEFSLGAILSITTGILCTEDFRDVTMLTSYMIGGEGVYTHAMSRLADEITPYLYEQLPFLHEITEDMVAGGQCLTLVHELGLQYGATHELIPMHLEDHTELDPIEELKRIDGFDMNKVITIDLDDLKD